MSSVVEDEVRKNDEVVGDNGELVDKSVKEAEIPQKVIHVPRPPPQFSQRLVKKTYYYVEIALHQCPFDRSS